jgi:hypothetical protein
VCLNINAFFFVDYGLYSTCKNTTMHQILAYRGSAAHVRLRKSANLIEKKKHLQYLKGLSREIVWLKILSFDRFLLMGEAPRFSTLFYPSSLM